MDESSIHNAIDNLSEDQRHKLYQFKDLSGFEEIKCFQILQANDWNIEIALDLALDGAYNDFPSLENYSSNIQNDSAEMVLRRRYNSSQSDSPINDTVASENENDTSTNEGTVVTIWRMFNSIVKLPFIIISNAIYTLYEFIVSMFHPTLHYDPSGTVERFITEFEEKYGLCHPPFFRGTYSEVVEYGKRDIRFVLIYIHSSSYKDIDKFCTTVITTQKFIDLINSENIVFWSCSVDYPEGYKAFQSLKIGTYPFIALIGLKNHQMIVMKKIEGFQTLDSIIAQLKIAISNNEYSLMAARVDRQERDMATLIRAQQDAAFEESLKADQEKERKKKEEKERKEREERLAREKIEEEKEKKEKVLQLKKSLLSQIPMEPDVSDVDSFRIMFKLPNGTRLERRFSQNDLVKHLYYYVFCYEESLFNFKLRTNFPTSDLPGHSPTLKGSEDEKEMNILLKDCNLGSNIMLFVHDLDS